MAYRLNASCRWHPHALMMYRETLNYARLHPRRRTGFIAGWISLCLLLAIPIGFLSPILVVPLISMAFIAGITAIVASKLRSIPGWIGLTISSCFLGVCAWLLLTGR